MGATVQLDKNRMQQKKVSSGSCLKPSWGLNSRPGGAGGASASFYVGQRCGDDDKEAVQPVGIIGSHLPLETGQRK